MARSARCDVRREAAVFVGSDETILPDNPLCHDAFRRLLLQIGGANIVGADRAWNPPTSSSFGDEKACPSLLLSSARRSAIRSLQMKVFTDEGLA
jgi:hypothetical protein